MRMRIAALFFFRHRGHTRAVAVAKCPLYAHELTPKPRCTVYAGFELARLVQAPAGLISLLIKVPFFWAGLRHSRVCKRQTPPPSRYTRHNFNLSHTTHSQHRIAFQIGRVRLFLFFGLGLSSRSLSGTVAWKWRVARGEERKSEEREGDPRSRLRKCKSTCVSQLPVGCCFDIFIHHLCSYNVWCSSRKSQGQV